MAKVRALLQRAQIHEGEVALLRGMVRQLRWASPAGDPLTSGPSAAWHSRERESPPSLQRPPGWGHR